MPRRQDGKRRKENFRREKQYGKNQDAWRARRSWGDRPPCTLVTACEDDMYLPDLRNAGGEGRKTKRIGRMSDVLFAACQDWPARVQGCGSRAAGHEERRAQPSSHRQLIQCPTAKSKQAVPEAQQSGNLSCPP